VNRQMESSTFERESTAHEFAPDSRLGCLLGGWFWLRWLSQRLTSTPVLAGNPNKSLTTGGCEGAQVRMRALGAG
jgi:hypothetical protein